MFTLEKPLTGEKPQQNVFLNMRASDEQIQRYSTRDTTKP